MEAREFALQDRLNFNNLILRRNDKKKRKQAAIEDRLHGFCSWTSNFHLNKRIHS